MSDKKNIWWKHGVIYQIYPRSFMDSNGDGIGDINGITSKLDYLESLGIDAIWLSPVYPTPMKDFGYDISDYRSIDHVFGTDSDFDSLVENAAKRGIKIIMDIVFNHTSDQHPWFIESRSSKDNPKRDWYVWHDPVKGGYPNNWMAAFGGRAWEFDEKTGQYYLHSFLKEQPDLNWRNPAVLDELKSIMNYWIDRGVAGFRYDVINLFVKDIRFRSNPLTIGRPRPYDLQKHIYDRDRQEVHNIMREVRRTADAGGAIMTVGEIMVAGKGDPSLAASYLGMNDELHLSFDFSLITAPWSAEVWYTLISRWITECEKRNSWPCHVLSNHDQSRSVSRFGSGEKGLARARAAALLMLTLKGTPFLYYGEEIGMADGKIRRSQMHDPVGIKYWPLNSGRDPERTPMQWDSSVNAGFSTVKPWLPVSPDRYTVNIEGQLENPASILSLYKRLISLRKQMPALHSGDWIPYIKGKNDIISWFRTSGSQKIIAAVNFSRAVKTIDIPEGEKYKIILTTDVTGGSFEADGRVSIPGYGGVLMEKLS
jgi:alpha-glucosidase